MTGGKGRTVLVVDDDTVHRMIIARVAQKAGYDVAGVASRQEAMDHLAAHPATVVTVDLSLGEDSGLKVLADIAGGPQSPPPLVIIISGTASDVRERATAMAQRLRLRVLDTLHKPVDLRRLRELLDVAAAL